MFLSKLSINRPVMVTVGLLIFVIFGAMAYFTMSLNLMPNVDIPVVNIQTIYAGAGPLEVETQITKKIEDEISTVSKIDKIESYSMDNVSIVSIVFDLDKDIDVAIAEVKQKVDAIIMNLPSDAENPIVDKMDIGATPIMQIKLSGELSGLELYEIADKQLKDKFSQIAGVAKVDIIGGQKREIKVEFDDRVVFQNMISLPQMAQMIGAANMDMPGGQFKQSDQEYSVRLDGKFDKLSQLDNLDVQTVFGTRKLRQIADVTDSGEEIRKRSIYFNNIENLKEDNIVQLSITKTSSGNPVDIANSVKAAMSSIKKEIPQSAKLKIVNDETDYIQGTVDDTMSNVLLGILFTSLVLLFFLHDIRSTLIVAVAMPVSIVSTFMLMKWAGYSFNMLSLMGISTSVGVLVSNSVVVLENIFRHKEMGHNRRVAADKGTAEVVVAVIASTFTNIVVFVPIAMMDTMIGHILREFAMTVTFATIFSLLVSFTLTPMMASLILPEKKKKNKIGAAFEKMFHHWEWIYRSTLKVVLKNKFTALLTTLITFLIFGLTMFIVAPNLGFELFPKTDEGMIKIDLELPVGYNLEETSKVYDKIEAKVSKHKEVEKILVKLGSQGQTSEGVNMATVDVTLVDLKKRSKSSQELVDIFIEELSVIPNAKLKISPKSSTGAGGSAIEFYLKGKDDAGLKRVTEELLTKGKSIDGLINFDASLRSGKPEITLIPKRKDLAAAGLSVYELSMALRSAVEGIVASSFDDNGDEYDIKISLKDDAVDSPEEVRNIPVVSKRGVFRLSQLADVEFKEGTTKIVHKDKIKSVKFTGDIGTGFAQGDVVKEITRIQNNIELPKGFRFAFGGETEMMQENIVEMGKAFGLAILLTYLLLAAILESFLKPILVLITIPLALIGVILGLYLSGINMGLMAMLGIIMLIGVVVNAAILLLDYTEQLRREGKENKEALIQACPTKFKPILMSSIAIVFGMLPMALGIGESGAEMRIPLGIVSIGGIVVSTFMTLYVMPAMYYLTTKKHMKVEERV